MSLEPQHRPQRTFAGYRLGRLLGQGGMGQVHEALDPSLGRPVALKILGVASEGSADRFQREGELAARLEHPGIVRVHAAGSAEGKSYIVYELVSGAQPLDQAWAERGLRQRVTWIRDVARALGYAHEQGVVHRDVKPDNLLVDELGKVRITDFGVAGAADLERLTKTGALVGTPTHMAPEQMTGEGRPGPPTDVWALGVVLYQALCDQLPFEGHDWLTLATQVAGGRYRRPSDSAAEVPLELERVCRLALTTDPSGRPATGAALAALLDDWLEGRQPGGGLGRTSRLGIAGGLLLPVVLVGLWAVLPSGETLPPQGSSSPTSSSSATPGPRATQPASARRTQTEVYTRLRKAQAGPERLDAYREARAWLKSCEDPSQQTLLSRRLAVATREPLARLRFELPAGRAKSTIRAYVWGDRILIGGDKWQACLLDPSRVEIVSPWKRCFSLNFVALSPKRGLVGKGQVVRGPDGFRYLKQRKDFKTPRVALKAQVLGPGGRYFASGGHKLSWGTQSSRAGMLRLEAPAEFLCVSPNGQFLAAGCTAEPGEDPDVKAKVLLQIYSLGERPLLVYERVLVSKVRALTWIDDDTLGVGQLVGNVLFLHVPSERILIQVGPPSTTEALRPLGGVTRLTVGRKTVLAVGRHGLLGWKAGTAGKAPEEVLRVVWGREAEGARVYSAVALDGILWLFTKLGEAYAYSAHVADYAAEAGPN